MHGFVTSGCARDDARRTQPGALSPSLAPGDPRVARENHRPGPQIGRTWERRTRRRGPGESVKKRPVSSRRQSGAVSRTSSRRRMPRRAGRRLGIRQCRPARQQCAGRRYCRDSSRSSESNIQRVLTLSSRRAPCRRPVPIAMCRL